MYIFVTMPKVITILSKLGIDITSYTSYEQTVIFLLVNIFYIITTFIILYIVYRLFLKLYNFFF